MKKIDLQCSPLLQSQLRNQSIVYFLATTGTSSGLKTLLHPD